MWKRNYGSSIETPPYESGGTSRDEPTVTAPHLDSTHCIEPVAPDLVIKLQQPPALPG
jgi:hypothetical protein